MSKRDSSNEKSGGSVRDVFAYPFKVLRDIFTDPPFAPEPEFTRFDLNALRDSGASSTVLSRKNLARATRRKIRIPILLLALILVVIALIIVA